MLRSYLSLALSIRGDLIMCNFSPLVSVSPRRDHGSGFGLWLYLGCSLLAMLFISGCVSNPVPHPGVGESAESTYEQPNVSGNTGTTQGVEADDELGAESPAIEDDFATTDGFHSEADSVRAVEPIGDVAGHDVDSKDVHQADGIALQNDSGPWPD
jgi:hypothetical protein